MMLPDLQLTINQTSSRLDVSKARQLGTSSTPSTPHMHWEQGRGASRRQAEKKKEAPAVVPPRGLLAIVWGCSMIQNPVFT